MMKSLIRHTKDFWSLLEGSRSQGGFPPNAVGENKAFISDSKPPEMWDPDGNINMWALPSLITLPRTCLMPNRNTHRSLELYHAPVLAGAVTQGWAPRLIFFLSSSGAAQCLIHLCSLNNKHNAALGWGSGYLWKEFLLCFSLLPGK